MKYISYLCKMVFLFIIFSSFMVMVDAKEKNLVNIYLFYSDTCPHCANEKKLLSELEDTYDNIRIYKYEVGNSDNSKLLEEVASMFDTKVPAVPIGKRVAVDFPIHIFVYKYHSVFDFHICSHL